jgi:hypothetical protein
MMAMASAAREWRQFVLLSRDSVRNLLNTAVYGDDSDPMQLVIWGVALLATPPWLYAFKQTFLYTGFRTAPVALVETVVLGDRLFFLVYGMLASALLAALVWDALLPDRRDQEIVGVLPVRPRTVAMARLAAATAVAAAFAFAISVPSGVLFAISSTSHPAIGFLPVVLVAHVVATILGSLFAFFVLLIVRGLIAVCAGPGLAHASATVLQLVTIVGLVEVFFFLPSVLPTLARRMLDDGVSAVLLPPILFAALYSWIAGTDRGLLIEGARIAVIALVASAALVSLVYLLPAAHLARRTLETLPRARAHGAASLARLLVPLLLRRAVARSIFLFAVASLTRSRRHLLILATYVGLAIATAGISLVAAQMRGTLSVAEPQPYLLALPLVLLFFLILGLRTAFSVPTDVDANWPFRLAEPKLATVMAATEALLLTVAVVPVCVAVLIAALSAGWPEATAVRLALCDLASGILLIECVLCGWTKVPFTCAHAPTQETLKSRWPVLVIALNLYAFQLANLQQIALQSAWRTATYLLVVGGMAIAIRIWRTYSMRAATPQFDVPEAAGLQTLGLSGALR